MDLQELKVTRKAIAELLKYKNENYINELCNDHNAPKSGHDSYPLFEFIQWYIFSYLDGKHRGEVERLKAEKPQDDLARKSAELKELLIQEKKKILINAGAVESAWLNEISVISSYLDSVSIKASSKLLNIADQKTIKEILDKEINELKVKIADLRLDIHTTAT